MKISDAIRNDFLRNDDVGGVAYRQLLCIADRIDREMVELPKDADGKPIRLKDWVWYVGIDAEITKDNPQHVVVFVSDLGMNGIYAVTRDYPDKAISPKMMTHRAPEPADSWEKLEEDAKKTPCDYALAPLDDDGFTTCYGCRFEKNESCSQEMTLDILKRAKKLADDYHARYCPNCGAEVASR